VWIEAPGSITLEFPDMPALVAAVKAHKDAHPGGIVTALDNTWGAGLAFNAFDLGIDISVQALTKYPSGGADVLMGSVVTRDEALHHLVHFCHMRVGYGIGGNDAELVLRGLNSMALRYAAQDAATRELAAWLANPAANRHRAAPGLARLARPRNLEARLHGRRLPAERRLQARIHAGAGGPFLRQPQALQAGLQLGRPMSLCAPYDIPALRTMPWPYKGGLVRFSVGLEAVADLQADIAQALEKA
jgi:cystathionine beta-lyase